MAQGELDWRDSPSLGVRGVVDIDVHPCSEQVLSLNSVAARHQRCDFQPPAELAEPETNLMAPSTTCRAASMHMQWPHTLALKQSFMLCSSKQIAQLNTSCL